MCLPRIARWAGAAAVFRVIHSRIDATAKALRGGWLIGRRAHPLLCKDIP